MTDRITHMLVLIDRNPAKGEAAFVQGMLGWLRDTDGSPYSQFVDAETKIHVMIVGSQDFSENYIANMALVHFRAVWNRTPVLSAIIYQRFNGPEGNGTTIEQRTTESKTEPQEAEPQETRNLVDAVHRGDLESVKHLLAKGANPNARERDGSPTDATVLMRAAEAGHTEIVKLLLGKGADVNAIWNVGGAALAMIAGNENSTDMVRLLIAHGANVNAKDEHGQTALTAAANYDRVENVRLLLDNGAEVNAKKHDGATALTGAVKYGNTDTVRLLLERGAPVSAAYGDQATMELMALAKKPEIAGLLMTAAREQFMKAGKEQKSQPANKQPSAAERPPVPVAPSPSASSHAAAVENRLQSKKWWQFWK